MPARYPTNDQERGDLFLMAGSGRFRGFRQRGVFAVMRAKIEVEFGSLRAEKKLCACLKMCVPFVSLFRECR